MQSPGLAWHGLAVAVWLCMRSFLQGTACHPYRQQCPLSSCHQCVVSLCLSLSLSIFPSFFQHHTGSWVLTSYPRWICAGWPITHHSVRELSDNHAQRSSRRNTSYSKHCHALHGLWGCEVLLHMLSQLHHSQACTLSLHGKKLVGFGSCGHCGSEWKESVEGWLWKKLYLWIKTFPAPRREMGFLPHSYPVKFEGDAKCIVNGVESARDTLRE